MQSAERDEEESGNGIELGDDAQRRSVCSPRHHDRDDKLLNHRPLVGRVAAWEDQQRRDHSYQPATAVFDDRRVVSTERVDECGGQRSDHFGLFGHLAADLIFDRASESVGLAMDVGGSQHLTVFKISVQRRAGTPCDPGNLVHPYRTGIVASEKPLGGVENPVCGYLGAALREPVIVGHQDITRNGTDSGRRT
jgi:hypothetical protein